MGKQKRRRYSDWFTEEVWLTCRDQFSLGYGLQALVDEGHPGLTDRKAQLFEVACACRVVHLVRSDLCRRTIDLAEIAADAEGGPLTVSPLPIYRVIQSELDGHGPPPDFEPRPAHPPLVSVALEMAAALACPTSLGSRVRDMIGSWAVTALEIARGTAEKTAEVEAQIVLLHDTFGNPFRPVTVESGWLTSTVVSLAQAIYDERKFENMPILGDALEEAGCEEEQVLEHCRSAGPHVRGCWVVDLLLGKK